MYSRKLTMAAPIGVDAWLLAAYRPVPRLVHHLASPRAWLTSVGADTATAELASAALWLAGAWLAIGSAAALTSALPGVIGRSGRAVARVFLPRALYRLAAGAAGMGVLLCPAVAGAASSTPAVSAGAHAGTATPTPAWPTDDTLPAPAWPNSSARPTTPRAAGPTTTPGADRAAPTGHRTGTVVVQPGDSLWRIAAARLPGHPSERRVAVAWPRWYAANRRVVGNDPDHIVAGQLLYAPIEEDPS